MLTHLAVMNVESFWVAGVWPLCTHQPTVCKCGFLLMQGQRLPTSGCRCVDEGGISFVTVLITSATAIMRAACTVNTTHFFLLDLKGWIELEVKHCGCMILLASYNIVQKS